LINSDGELVKDIVDEHLLNATVITTDNLTMNILEEDDHAISDINVWSSALQG